jgi:hypothetical protein
LHISKTTNFRGELLNQHCCGNLLSAAAITSSD